MPTFVEEYSCNKKESRKSKRGKLTDRLKASIKQVIKILIYQSNQNRILI